MKFSIIIPYYQGTISDERFEACLTSLTTQTFKDFETIILHDGSLMRLLTDKQRKLIEELDADFVITRRRYNDYGHSLRTEGMIQATGDYIVHLNSDNVLYDVLKDIAVAKYSSIYILAMKMVGVEIVGFEKESNKPIIARTDEMNPDKSIIIKGEPVKDSIDVMQLVMERRLWEHYGWWYDKSMNSDGNMYPRFCKENSYSELDLIIGEHW